MVKSFKNLVINSKVDSMIKVSAPGNVFFFGEHSVVYERPAIVAAVDMRTYASLRERTDGLVVVNSEGYGRVEERLDKLLKLRFEKPSDYRDDMDPIRHLISQNGDELADSSGFEIDIRSDIPRKSGGMSSSTAVLCAVRGAINRYTGIEMRLEDYFDSVYPLQVLIHGGKASGSEITSSSVGGYNLVRIDKSGEKARLERETLGTHEYKLVIGNTGLEAKTAEAVQQVMAAWERNKIRYEGFFDEIGGIVKKGKDVLLSGDMVNLGGFMNENHRILSEELDVSSHELENLIRTARDAGAYGAKLSGGGKGGIMIALVDSDTEQKVADAIRGAGGTPYLTTVGVEGLRDES